VTTGHKDKAASVTPSKFLFIVSEQFDGASHDAFIQGS
jgi:hypothetical protein